VYIFKTSGATYETVVRNQKHAFVGEPKNWYPGEWVLVSKNRKDCGYGEKQIQFIMMIDHIRHLRPGEAGNLWPGNENRWQYLVECKNGKHLRQPFDLADAIGRTKYYKEYRGVVSFKRLPYEDEDKVLEYLKKSGAI
jgi:hypothetical protein